VFGLIYPNTPCLPLRGVCMLNATFRPLDRWPVARENFKSRRDATFRSTYPQTLDLLESELAKLRAKDIVIQVEGLTLEYIRNDGWPKSGNWKNGYGGPGVIVSFESSKGTISMPCDKFRDWQDNLRAIAKSLEALRMVDRYGVTRGNEQYRGWARLESGIGNGSMDRDKAIAFLALLSGVHADKLNRYYLVDDLRMLIRAQRIAHHPDRATNDADRTRREELSAKIGQAEEVLCG
jgi:hypothetical protein